MADTHIWDYFTMLNGVAPDLYMPEVGKLINGKPTQFDLDLRTYSQKDEAALCDNGSVIMYGKNFNRITAESSYTYKESKDIVNILLDNVSGNDAVLFVDIDGGVTGIPLEAADRNEVSCVICYTSDPTSKQQLIRNSEVYSLSDSMYVVDALPSEKIDWNCICSIGKRSNVDITRFLTANVKNITKLAYGGKFSKTKQITDHYNIKNVGTTTIFINKKVPDEFSYSMPPVASRQFNKEYTQRFFNETPTENLSSTYAAEPIHDKSYMNPGKWKDFCVNMPKPKYTMVDPVEWLKDVQGLVIYMLSKIDPDMSNSKKENIASSRLIKKYWTRALIHMSVSAEKNYETLETVGDAVLKTSFFTHIVMRYPDLSSGRIDNMKGMYLSTVWFSRFCRELGLNEWIASNFTITDRICEDVLESVTGALYLAANEIEDGLGIVLSNKFINIIASDLDLYNIDDIVYGPKKTVVVQYGEKLGLGGNWINVNTRNNKVGTARFVTSMNINNKAIDYLEDSGINTSNLRKSFSFVADDKAASELGAYTNVYYALKDSGITFEWVEERQLLRKRGRSKLIVSLYSRALDKASPQFDTIKLKPYDKDPSVFVGAILLGEKTMPDGTIKIKNLATYEIGVNNLSNNNDRTMLAEAGVLNKYLGK